MRKHHDKILLVAARDAVMMNEMKKLPVAFVLATWYINKRRFGGTTIDP